MRSPLRFIAIPVAVVLTAVACSDSSTGIFDPQAPTYLPEPVMEQNHHIPDSDRIYFSGPASPPYANGFQAAMEAQIEEVLAARVRLWNVWLPRHRDICMYWGSVTLIIIEADRPYDYLVEMGWLESPLNDWFVNCGVDSLWHYDFDPD